MTTNPPEIAPKYAADFLAKAAEKDPHEKNMENIITLVWCGMILAGVSEWIYMLLR